MERSVKVFLVRWCLTDEEREEGTVVGVFLTLEEACSVPDARLFHVRVEEWEVGSIFGQVAVVSERRALAGRQERMLGG